MFARHQRQGWYSWGNEAAGRVPALKLLTRDR
jgi:N6-adenosine-specific RNA methylase IME4